MMRQAFAALVSLAVLSASHSKEPSYYLIGNSLTWDTVPQRLDGDVQFHVDCGTSLPYVFAHPEKPCVKASTLWPTALKDKQYSFVSVQPHYGSTLAQDVETISQWMTLQPTAVFVLHTGWARQGSRESEFASYTAPGTMVHSLPYFRALVAELRQRHPGREIRISHAQTLLAQVAADIDAKQAPFANIADLYRDDIHMKLDTGRYLMHNAMRHALGQATSSAGFETVDPKVRTYLDGVLGLLHPTKEDRALVTRMLHPAVTADRAAIASQIGDASLRERMLTLVPAIERAAKERSRWKTLDAEVTAVGGKVTWSPIGPPWLYLVTGDVGTELLDVPTAVDLYNGNNPLKGKGGRNEQVTDAWLERLVGFDTLRSISLANCSIHGDGLRHIGTLTGLRELNLTLTPVADDGLAHLAGLTELRSLGLASTQCTGTGFEKLQPLRKLESINFHFTPLNDAGLKAISQLPISERLWFAHTHFTDAGAASLANLTRLKRCGIGSKEKTSSGEAVAALVNLPLVELSLLDNQADPVGVAHAAKIATLKKLDVSYGPKIGNDSLKLVAAMPALEEFVLGGAAIDDEGLQALAASKSLKVVTLGKMKKVTPAGVDRLRTARPELRIEMR